MSVMRFSWRGGSLAYIVEIEIIHPDDGVTMVRKAVCVAQASGYEVRW